MKRVEEITGSSQYGRAFEHGWPSLQRPAVRKG